MFEQVGGQSVIDKLVDDFYHIMSTDPMAEDCLRAHQGRDLSEAAHKLKFFLSGWLGGPQLYLEKFGHPRLRMRHMPFTIGRREAEQWLYCMYRALKLSTIDDKTQEQMMEAFLPVANMLIRPTAPDQ
jgi:hemoglobin